MSKEFRKNAKNYYGNVSIETFARGLSQNMACHDLCRTIKAPVGIQHLLELGEKYCARKTHLEKKTIDTMMERMKINIR